MNRKQKGFTLTEALIVLVILGVIAAITIPSMLYNTEQHEYKTALKKALSVLNQTIEMNIALDNMGPLETESMVDHPDHENSLFNMFRKRMTVISTTSDYTGGGESNYAFFTTDGTRFEFPATPSLSVGSFSNTNSKCATPGTEIQDELGDTFDTPCLIIVDVNGSRKPNPQKDTTLGYKVAAPTGRSRILDVFPIIITDVIAYPYGVVGQRAVYQKD